MLEAGIGDHKGPSQASLELLKCLSEQLSFIQNQPQCPKPCPGILVLPSVTCCVAPWGERGSPTIRAPTRTAQIADLMVHVHSAHKYHAEQMILAPHQCLFGFQQGFPVTKSNIIVPYREQQTDKDLPRPHTVGCPTRDILSDGSSSGVSSQISELSDDDVHSL